MCPFCVCSESQYVETLISRTHSGKAVAIPFAFMWFPIKGQVNREVIEIYKDVGHHSNTVVPY